MVVLVIKLFFSQERIILYSNSQNNHVNLSF